MYSYYISTKSVSNMSLFLLRSGLDHSEQQRIFNNNLFLISLMVNWWCYINHVLSLNNTRFGDFVDRIYPIELEIKNVTDTVMSTSYLDLHPEIDSDCLRQMEHIRGHLWHRHHIAVNKDMVPTVQLSKW
jgi:hypothetical protein